MFVDRSEDGEKEVIAPIVDVVVCGGGALVSQSQACYALFEARCPVLFVHLQRSVTSILILG